jgi:hypothetical protein
MALPPGFPAKAGPARDKAILDAVRSGQASWTWSPVTSQRDGHTLVMQVMTDGLKLGGVRLAGSANLCQTIADMLGACLQTARINDLAWQQAKVQIPPGNMWPNDTDTATLVRETDKLDGYIAGRTGLVAPVGKPWVLSKSMSAKRATLYGWQSATPIAGIPLYKSPATPGVQVIQPLSAAHDLNFCDYSSLANLVARQCTLDGQPDDLARILQDPSVAQLASHEGVIPVRQPGASVGQPLGMQGLPPSIEISGEPVSMVAIGALSSKLGGAPWGTIIGSIAGWALLGGFWPGSVVGAGVGWWIGRRFKRPAPSL